MSPTTNERARRGLKRPITAAFVALALSLTAMGALAGTDTSASELRGTVANLDTGKPLQGASVTVSSAATFWSWPFKDATKTDVQGQFRIRLRSRDLIQLEVRKDGYVPAVLLIEYRPSIALKLMSANARTEDLAVARVEIPLRRPMGRFRLDLEKGRLVPESADYDVEVQMGSGPDSTVVAVAGPGRSLRVEERGSCPGGRVTFPRNLRVAPESGYLKSARLDPQTGPKLCFVRRDRGPRYGAFDLFPRSYFPSAVQVVGPSFDVVYNRAGGRGFSGAKRPIFE